MASAAKEFGERRAGKVCFAVPTPAPAGPRNGAHSGPVEIGFREVSAPGTASLTREEGDPPRSGVQVRSAGVSRVGSSASTSPSDWARGNSVNTRRR